MSMARPQQQRHAFHESRIYEYPEHLLPYLEEMPSAPGVYIFHADGDTLPLYIGKSINLRARLLSHFRAENEARLLRMATRISYIRTAGEIGALLLEARLIKERQPLFNQRLRRNHQLCSIRLSDGKPTVVYCSDVDFAKCQDLFGLFSSRFTALAALRTIADTQMLCYGSIGLEKLYKGKACFRSMIHKCAGVCRGAETLQAHDKRLLAGLEELRVQTWPFPAAIGIEESFEDLTQIHVINNWCYLGSADSIATARKLTAVALGFDADGYKILCRPLLTGTAKVTPL